MSKESVQIFSSTDRDEVVKISEALKAEQIPCSVIDSSAGADGMGSVFGGAPSAAGFVITVSEADSDRAMGLLNKLFPEYFAVEEEASSEEEVFEDEETTEEQEASVPPVVSIAGILMVLGSLATLVVGNVLKLPGLGLPVIISGALGLVLEGYAGFKTRKILHTLLLIVAVVCLIGGVMLTTVESGESQKLKSVMNQGLSLLNTKKYAESLDKYKEALVLAKKLKNIDAHILILSYMGAIYEARGVYDKAYSHYAEALKVGQDNNNRTFESIIKAGMDKVKANM